MTLSYHFEGSKDWNVALSEVSEERGTALNLDQ